MDCRSYLGPYLLGPNDENQGIYTGDARELAKAIPDESVDLIFTDPVYQNIEDYRWLAETAARVLKPGCDFLVYYAQFHLVETIDALRVSLDVRWPCVEKRMLGATGPRIWTYGLQTYALALLWCSKGKPRTLSSTRTDYTLRLPQSLNHAWSKNTTGTTSWITRYSEPGDIVWDTFCGGGSIESACKLRNRRWLAFEIDPGTAERARERVRNTQPPLFVMEPEQAVMDFQQG